MEPEEFVNKYESAISSQDWVTVNPFFHPDACVTFSTGEVFVGKRAIEGAYRRNFELIVDEEYRISNIHWIHKSSQFATYIFEFDWRGMINNQPASGGGRGTAVLIKQGSSWQLLTEHLGPR